jgi:hypothetical protein
MGADNVRIMPAIRCLHWGRVGDEPDCGTTGTLFALWPEPVGHDACFQAAGFRAFEDSDAQWDAEFDRVAERLVAELTAAAGAPVDAAPAMARAGRWPVVSERRLDPVEHLAAAAKDDQWPPCRLEFGSPVAAVITTRDGHPMFWIWLALDLAALWRESLRRVASQRLAVETSLRWSCLR